MSERPNPGRCRRQWYALECDLKGGTAEIGIGAFSIHTKRNIFEDEDTSVEVNLFSLLEFLLPQYRSLKGEVVPYQLLSCHNRATDSPDFRMGAISFDTHVRTSLCLKP